MRATFGLLITVTGEGLNQDGDTILPMSEAQFRRAAQREVKEWVGDLEQLGPSLSYRVLKVVNRSAKSK